MMKKKMEYPIAAKAAVVTAAALLIGGGTTASVLTAYADSAQESVYEEEILDEDEIVDEDADENEDVDGTDETDAKKWNIYAATPSNATPTNAGIMMTAMRTVTSGKCGENLTWKYNDATKTLTISGSGAMEGYSNVSNVPWRGLWDQIQKVVIGDEVTAIGMRAFSCCNVLETVTIGDEVTIIGEYAFSQCEKLETVVVGKKVTEIGESAFAYCGCLKELTLENQVGKIGDAAFYLCKALEKVTFGKNLSEIGDSAFADCYALKRVVIQAKIPPKLGSYAFTSTAISSGAEDSGIFVLYGYADTYRQNEGWDAYRTYIQNGLFGECGENLTWEYDSKTKTLTISGSGAMKDYDPVNQAPWYALREEIQTVVIGDKVTTIGNNAFKECTGLTKIELGDKMTTIGTVAFYGCTGLTEIELGDEVTTIGNSAFYGCTGLKEVKLGDKVTTIRGYAFYECTGLTKVELGDEVTTIEAGAFADCTGLTEIILGETVTEINTGAFYGCDSLKTVTIKATKKPTIGEVVFYETPLAEGADDSGIFVPYDLLEAYQNDANLSSVKDRIYGAWGKCGENLTWAYDNKTKTLTVSGSGAMEDYNKFFDQAPWYALRGQIQTVAIGNEVTTIGDSAFYGCTGLTEVKLGDKVTTIGDSAFSGCTGLTKLELGDEVITIEAFAFEECTGLTEVKLGDKVTTIGGYAFSECTGLTKVELGDEVTTIEAGTFSECTRLIEIELGDKVTTIGDNAFCGCTGLTKVELGDKVPEIGGDVFTDTYFVNENLKGIIVPNESYTEYLNAWSVWADYIAMADVPEADEDDVEEDEDDLSASTGNAGAVLGKKNLPSYVEVGVWTQTADGNWTFTSSGNGAGGTLAKGWVAAYNPYAENGQESWDWFYFDANGVMVTGWFTDPTDGNTYYLNPNSDGRRGAMLVGEQWIDRDGDGVAEQYYFNEVSDGTRGKLVR